MAVVALMPAAAACERPPASTPIAVSAPAVRIGVLGGLAGDNAGLTVPIKNGAELAVTEYNASHPDAPVELAKFDTEGLAERTGPIAAAAAADSTVVAMIGPAFPVEAEVASPIFEEAGLPAITASATYSQLSENSWATFHRGVAEDSAQAMATVRYLRDVVRPRRLFLVHDQSPDGAALADAVRTELAARQVGEETVSAPQTNFDTLVAAVTAARPDTLVFAGYSAEAGLLLRQLRAAGWTGAFVGGGAIYDPNLLSVAGAGTGNTAAISACPPPSAAFAADYRAAYGIDPVGCAAVAFDLARVILAGLAAGHSTRADLLAYLRDYSGRGRATSVTYAWTPEGELSDRPTAAWVYRAQRQGWTFDRRIPTS